MAAILRSHGRKVFTQWLHQTVDSQLPQRESTQPTAQHHRGQRGAQETFRKNIRRNKLKSLVVSKETITFANEEIHLTSHYLRK